MTLPAAADPYDIRLALRAKGALASFNQAGILTGADVHIATTLGRLTNERDSRVLLAVALAVRAVRLGSVCVRLADVRATVTADLERPEDAIALAWPDPALWRGLCEASPLIAQGSGSGSVGAAGRPVRFVDGLLYLDRYWNEEQLVRAELDDRSARTAVVDPDTLTAALTLLFPGPAPDYQRLAVAASALGSLTLVAGGPGTGKTTTVARLLALLNLVLDPQPRVALAAPTGKAAARLQEAVAEESGALARDGLATLPAYTASTLHRLLGFRPGSHTRFRHNRGNRLPFDVVVVDETSMVSLTLMARLMEALRPDARLILVGDPDQLASVEAGAVLGDLVHRPARLGADRRLAALSALLPADLSPAAEVEAEMRTDVIRLRHNFRYGNTIGTLAAAIREGRPDDVITLLRSGAAEVEFVETDTIEQRIPTALDGLRADVVEAGRALDAAAHSGDVAAALEALGRHRLLCGHRRGPYGVSRWSREVQRWLTAAIDGLDAWDEWYVGRPLLVTANDYDAKLYNGDTGVVMAAPSGPVAAFGRGDVPTLLAPSRLAAVETVHAMTVHRSQGSQYERVSVLLPPTDSQLLTRELLYTAATRAQELLRLIGSEQAVRAAVTRPVVRASGLRRPQPVE